MVAVAVVVIVMTCSSSGDNMHETSLKNKTTTLYKLDYKSGVLSSCTSILLITILPSPSSSTFFLFLSRNLPCGIKSSMKYI